MSYQVEEREKYAFLKIDAEKLDSNISPQVKSELVMLNSKGFKNIVMDLTATRYCDSSGLSAILVGNRLCKNANGTFVICGIQPQVAKLISISQLDNLLNITPTPTEAEEFVFMEEVERGLDD